MANLAELEAKFKQADEQLKEAEVFIKDYQTFIETFVQKEKVLSQLSAFFITLANGLMNAKQFITNQISSSTQQVKILFGM